MEMEEGMKSKVRGKKRTRRCFRSKAGKNANQLDKYEKKKSPEEER